MVIIFLQMFKVTLFFTCLTLIKVSISLGPPPLQEHLRPFYSGDSKAFFGGILSLNLAGMCLFFCLGVLLLSSKGRQYIPLSIILTLFFSWFLEPASMSLSAELPKPIFVHNFRLCPRTLLSPVHNMV